MSGSVYCVLIMNYLCVVDADFFAAPYWKYGIPLAVVVIVMVMNLFGVDFLGNISGFFLFVTLAPFAVLFFWSLSVGGDFFSFTFLNEFTQLFYSPFLLNYFTHVSFKKDVNPKDWIILPPKGFFESGKGFSELIVAFVCLYVFAVFMIKN